MVRRVVIVGSGPSALATTRTLLESNFDLEITVLDIKEDKEVVSPVGLKSHFGSTGIYNQSKSNIQHVNVKPVVWPSSGRGGFSRIWGAATGEDSEKHFSAQIKFGTVGEISPFATRSAIRIAEKYAHSENPTWNLHDHYVAVDPKSCISCGNCLTGCPTDAIWFAGNEWKKFPKVKFENDFKVHALSVIDGQVLISSDSGKSVLADWVFLAAGAIASTQILMTSGLIPNRVEIKDTNSLFFPALRFPIKEGTKSFALSQLSASFNLDAKTKFYLQLYPDSRNLTEALIQHRPYVGRALSKFWHMLSPFLSTGILYIDEENSCGLILTRTSKYSFELSPSKKNQMRRIVGKYRLRKSIFQDFGILPLFFLGKKGEPGESYHFGAISEILEFNNRVDYFPVRVVDSSALATLEPGPITDKVMNNAVAITKKFLGETNEIFN